MHAPRPPPGAAGWGGRIRTSEWRDQNPLPYHLATPHSSPAGAHLTAASGPPRARELRMHGRGVEPARHVGAPAVRDPGGEAFRLRRALEGGEHARTGAGEMRAGMAPEPLERLAHRPHPGPHHGLAVVAPARVKKGAYCDEGRISCQFRGLEYL